MRKLVSINLVAALIMAAVMSVAPQQANAQGAGLVSSIINRMERNRRDLRSLRAAIQMEKYNSQINDTDRSAGIVIYQPAGRNASVRVDWRSPQQETLAVFDGRYTLFRPRLNVAYQGNADSERNRVSSVLGFGLNITRQQVSSRFQASYIGEELVNGAATSHILLEPRGGASYRYAEVWVDGSGMPVQTRVVERNYDTTTVTLSNVQRNAPVSENDFRLQLGNGVRIVRS